MDNLMGRYRNVTFLAAAIFLQILGLAVQVKSPNENHPARLIRVWAVSTITPFEKGLVRVQSGTSDLWHKYFYLRGVRQENRELRDQIEQLQIEQVRMKQDADQAHRLQSLLGFKEQFIAKTLAAQVIGSSGSEQSRTVTIDRGSRDGIQTDMAVISATGVVGKVISVINKSTSQVLLINDQQSGVGTILEQSRLQGVLKGKSSGELVIDKIMVDEEVKPGDRVLTSGGDQIFPKGLIIGNVDRIEKGPEFLQVTVRPTAALNRLEEVLVILKKEERDPTSTATNVRASEILAERLPSVPDKPVAPQNAAGAATAAHPLAPRVAYVQPVTASSEIPGQVKSTAAPTPGAAKASSAPASNPTGAPLGTKAATTPSAQTSKPAPKQPAPATSKPVPDSSSTQPQPSNPGDTPQ
jgi:rod shape-determining protein MreC